MELQAREVKDVAAHLLAGLLANPHIYSQISDDAAKGQQEQFLTVLAIDLAESMIRKVNERAR
ncbi:MAG: hypothetical protein F6J97_03215 [Leptolyngbya sp. SIO4C1]|nr:hypothetical protein [Leptolyngbya sp. SIO4C1]